MTAVRAYPISIEWPSRWLSMLPPVAECRRSVIAELGLHDDALIGVGVDRIDYTKGIEERFLAVESLLEHHPELRGRFTFVELGAPSRTEIPRYHELERRSRSWRRGSTSASAREQRRQRLPADHSVARAAPAAHGVPLLPRGGSLLREQPARRHEPGRQGVRVGARRRPGRADPQRLHRRGARADRGADREPLRHPASQLGAGGGAEHERPTSRPSACTRCARWCRS